MVIVVVTTIMFFVVVVLVPLVVCHGGSFLFGFASFAAFATELAVEVRRHVCAGGAGARDMVLATLALERPCSAKQMEEPADIKRRHRDVQIARHAQSTCMHTSK